MLQTRTVAGIEGLKSLREAWVALHGSVDLFGRFEWHLAAALHLLTQALALSYLFVFDGETPLAILPIIESLETLRPFGVLKTLSLGLHSHLGLADFPLAMDADVPAIAAALREALWTLPQPWDVMAWPRCSESSNAMRLALALGGSAVYVSRAPSCNVLDINNDFKAFMQERSRNLQNNLKKSQKKLLDAGLVYLLRNGVPAALHGTPSAGVALAGAELSIEQTFAEFLRLEGSGWKGAAGTSSAIGLDASLRSFYESLLNQHSPDFGSKVTLLVREHTPIAGHFSVTIGECRHLLKIGYDESEAKTSPGQILLREVLEASHEHGYRRVNLVTDMPWHQPWRPHPVPTHAVLIFRQRWRSLLFVGLKHLFRAAKRLHGRIRSQLAPASTGQQR